MHSFGPAAMESLPFCPLMFSLPPPLPFASTSFGRSYLSRAAVVDFLSSFVVQNGKRQAGRWWLIQKVVNAAGRVRFDCARRRHTASALGAMVQTPAYLPLGMAVTIS